MDSEIASIAIASLSVFAAYFLISSVKLVINIDTLGKVTIFVVGSYFLANIINYVATFFILKPDMIDPIVRRKIVMLGALTISFLTVVIGLVMTATLL